MGDSESYIRLVHHMIEQCIVYKLSKEETMETLSKHANIKSTITAAVWKQLETENKEFFESYKKKREEGSTSYEAEISRRIQQVELVSDSDSDTDSGPSK